MSAKALSVESNPIPALSSPSPTSPPSAPSISASSSPSLTTAQLDLLYGQTLSVIVPEELFLSDYQAALDEKLLNLLGITHIVNASNGTVPNQFPELFHYFNVNVEDEDEADITPFFDSVETFLQQSPVGVKVLFHCRLGISRSPALVMAHLMNSRRWSLRDAYEKTKSKRPKVQPGLSFCKALLEYERKVFPEMNDNSISIQALCGGNQRYSIVSRQSAASIQRQSSLNGARDQSTSIAEEAPATRLSTDAVASTGKSTPEGGLCSCCCIM
jgi:protein-tyrosine phosphatase